MRLKIDRETLLKGVGRTLGVVDRRGTMPILANFLLQTDENRVVISATDLEVSFRGFYPGGSAGARRPHGPGPLLL